MAETDLRGWATSSMRPLHAVAVENPVYPGFPDIAYSLGLIEAKWVRKAPARPGTAVAVEHYTKEQRDFARAHAQAGGTVLMLLQVGREVFLISGRTAADRVGTATLEQIREMAVEKWGKRPSPRGLICAVLRHSRPRLPSGLSFKDGELGKAWSTLPLSTT